MEEWLATQATPPGSAPVLFSVRIPNIISIRIRLEYRIVSVFAFGLIGIHGY